MADTYTVPLDSFSVI